MQRLPCAALATKFTIVSAFIEDRTSSCILLQQNAVYGTMISQDTAPTWAALGDRPTLHSSSNLSLTELRAHADDHEVTWSTFGEGTACVLNDPDAVSTLAQDGIASSGDCREACEHAANCTGCQYHEESHKCEMWAKPITEALKSTGFECFVITSGVQTQGNGKQQSSPKAAWSSFGQGTSCIVPKGDSVLEADHDGVKDPSACREACESITGCASAQYREEKQVCKLWTAPVIKAVRSPGYECFVIANFDDVNTTQKAQDQDPAEVEKPRSDQNQTEARQENSTQKEQHQETADDADEKPKSDQNKIEAEQENSTHQETAVATEDHAVEKRKSDQNKTDEWQENSTKQNAQDQDAPGAGEDDAVEKPKIDQNKTEAGRENSTLKAQDQEAAVAGEDDAVEQPKSDQNKKKTSSQEKSVPSWRSMGPDSACRLSEDDATGDGEGSASRHQDVPDIEACKKLCEQTDGCTGAEYRESRGSCEVWTVPIGSTKYAPGYECAVYEQQQQQQMFVATGGDDEQDAMDGKKLDKDAVSTDAVSIQARPEYCGFAAGVNAPTLSPGAQCSSGDDCTTEKCQDLHDCVKMCNDCEKCHGVRFQPEGKDGIRCRLKAQMRYTDKFTGFSADYQGTEGRGWALYVNNRDQACAASK